MNITWMPTPESYKIALLTTALLGFVLTRSAEVRNRRFARILASMAAVCLFLSGLGTFQAVHTSEFIGIADTMGYLRGVLRVSIASIALAFLWTGVFSHFGTQLVFAIIGSERESQKVDLRPIEALARQGMHGKALRQLRKAKDTSAEGQLLKIQLLRHENKIGQAKRLCKSMIRHHEASPLGLEALLAQME